MIEDKQYSFTQESQTHLKYFSTALSNSQGDVATFGIQKNNSKFQGVSISKKETSEMFKILDEFLISNKVKEVVITPFSTKRIGESEFSDEFFLGPTGGCIYTFENSQQEIYLDLDCHKYGDFDEWGRDYSTFEENGILYLTYTKKSETKEDYTLYFGLDISKLSYKLKKEWIQKEYAYSKEREYSGDRYIYRLLALSEYSGKVICGMGFSQKEVHDQIELLRDHEDELKGFDLEISKETTPKTFFEMPLSEEVDIAYKLSSQRMYTFLNKDFNSPNLIIKNGCYAGFPWFTQVWSRDDLIASRGFIELGEHGLVKEKLFSYLNALDEATGLLPILSTKGAFSSPDACFWLAKRIDDFIYSLGERGELSQHLSKSQSATIYKKLSSAFSRIITNNWDPKMELLKVKPGDSWMDTIELYYPLDIQVQLLSFVSTLIDLSVINHKEETQRYLDLEYSLKEKIRSTYLRDGNLHNNPEGNEVTSNTFLAYYLAPNLFYRSEWESIFDKALRELKTSWGGISTLSKYHPEFIGEYSGENNVSYHRGDSWFWINNIAAIAMHDLNEKKYRKEIGKIISSSTTDILKMGTLGFGSEVSSSKNQLAQGAHAQLWSSSTYIELVHKVYNIQK